MQTLCDLRRLCSNEENIEPITLFAELTQNLEGINRYEWLEEHDEFVSTSDQFAQQQRQLMLKHGTNSFPFDHSTPPLVTSYQKPSDLINSTYDTSHSRWNGKCMILNLVSADSKRLVEPSVAEIDVQIIQELFEFLQFQVVVYNDLTTDILETGIERYSLRENCALQLLLTLFLFQNLSWIIRNLAVLFCL